MTEKLKPEHKRIIDYYNSLESKLGYIFLLKRIKHFGYYPPSKEHLSMLEAQRLMEDYLAQKLSLCGGASVLDAGCGMGEVAMYLCQKYGLKVTGVDLLNWNIEMAKKRSLSLGLQASLEFFVGDYTKSQLPNNNFDAVYTMETLVHVPNYVEALQEFRRILKPGGNLVLFEYSVRDLNGVGEKEKNIFNLITEGSGMYALPKFTHGKLSELVWGAGFTNVQSEEITKRIMPMYKRFYDLSYWPYQLIRLLGLQRKFINATTAYEGYSLLLKSEDYWRYNVITAQKPA